MRRLIRFLKPYRLQVILGPIFKLIEAILELIVPLVMADMIDVGVANHDVAYLWQRGGLLVLLGVVGREDLRWIRGLVRPVDKSGQAGVS